MPVFQTGVLNNSANAAAARNNFVVEYDQTTVNYDLSHDGLVVQRANYDTAMSDMLPPGNLLYNGYTVLIFNIDGTAPLSLTSTSLINGSNTLNIAATGDIKIWCDGNNYIAVAHGGF